jgi:hypothetical protein
VLLQPELLLSKGRKPKVNSKVRLYSFSRGCS